MLALALITEVYGPSSTALVSGDKIQLYMDTMTSSLTTANQQSPTKAVSGIGMALHGTIAVQKMHKSAGLPIQLYDINGVKLDDTTTYPKVRPQETVFLIMRKVLQVPVDYALGFSPKLCRLRQYTWIRFCIWCRSCTLQLCGI